MLGIPGSEQHPGVVPSAGVSDERADRQIQQRPGLGWEKLLGILIFSLVVDVLIGIAVYFISCGHKCKDHFSGVTGNAFADSLYFSSTTLTTTGFGDIAHTAPISKAFTAIYIAGNTLRGGTGGLGGGLCWPSVIASSACCPASRFLSVWEGLGGAMLSTRSLSPLALQAMEITRSLRCGDGFLTLSGFSYHIWSTNVSEVSSVMQAMICSYRRMMTPETKQQQQLLLILQLLHRKGMTLLLILRLLNRKGMMLLLILQQLRAGKGCCCCS